MLVQRVISGKPFVDIMCVVCKPTVLQWKLVKLIFISAIISTMHLWPSLVLDPDISTSRIYCLCWNIIMEYNDVTIIFSFLLFWCGIFHFSLYYSGPFCWILQYLYCYYESTFITISCHISCSLLYLIHITVLRSFAPKEEWYTGSRSE